MTARAVLAGDGAPGAPASRGFGGWAQLPLAMSDDVNTKAIWRRNALDMEILRYGGVITAPVS